MSTLSSASRDPLMEKNCKNIYSRLSSSENIYSIASWKLLFHSENLIVRCTVHANWIRLSEQSSRCIFQLFFQRFGFLSATKRIMSGWVHLKESRFMNIFAWKTCLFSSVIIKNIAAKCFVAFKCMTRKMMILIVSFSTLSLFFCKLQASIAHDEINSRNSFHYKTNSKTWTIRSRTWTQQGIFSTR